MAGMFERQAFALAVGVALMLTGCQALVGLEDRTLVMDASEPNSPPDAGRDGGVDGGQDAGGVDAGTDAGMDAAVDSGMDAAVDGGMDGGKDATVDERTLRCQAFCDSVSGACTGRNAVYDNQETCLGVCAELELGDAAVAEPMGNTVACRADQARRAVDTTEPFVHCPGAGPGGGGACGSNCESYCQLFSALCDTDVPDCETRCSGLRDLDEEGVAFGDTTFNLVDNREGETLQCRLVHLNKAVLDPDGECWRAAIAPRLKDGVEPPCTYPPGDTPRCEDYCRLHLTACTGDNTQYESQAQCLAVCATMDPGTGQHRGGQDTVGCRIAHSYNAFDGASSHCPHSGPGGQGVCGDNCASYCRVLETACSADFSFGSQAECVADCETNIAESTYTVKAGEAGGDTLACRLLHATRALGDASFCSAAVGGAPCTP